MRSPLRLEQTPPRQSGAGSPAAAVDVDSRKPQWYSRRTGSVFGGL